MARKPVKLIDQIRAAVDASGMSRYRICKRLGITESSMSKFMAGAGMRMETLDALAELLDLKITVGKGRQKGR